VVDFEARLTKPNIAGRAVSEVHTAARLLALRDGETFIAYRGNPEKDRTASDIRAMRNNRAILRRLLKPGGSATPYVA
jgi:hypothetical protein